MKKIIKSTLAAATLLLASTISISAQSGENEGTIIGTIQDAGQTKVYVVQDQNTGDVLKSLPMQAELVVGDVVEYLKIIQSTPNGDTVINILTSKRPK